MKNYYLALIASALLTVNIYAEEVEEVVVTASLTNQSVSDLTDPLHVVEGEDVAAPPLNVSIVLAVPNE